jgi:hypothetical protein
VKTYNDEARTQPGCERGIAVGSRSVGGFLLQGEVLEWPGMGGAVFW